LYSDETTLFKNAKVVGHLIYLSIANIACKHQNKKEGHFLLAILFVVPHNNNSHLKQLQLFHDCHGLIWGHNNE
jgi:hypothetical protein